MDVVSLEGGRDARGEAVSCDAREDRRRVGERTWRGALYGSGSLQSDNDDVDGWSGREAGNAPSAPCLVVATERGKLTREASLAARERTHFLNPVESALAVCGSSHEKRKQH